MDKINGNNPIDENNVIVRCVVSGYVMPVVLVEGLLAGLVSYALFAIGCVVVSSSRPTPLLIVVISNSFFEKTCVTAEWRILALGEVVRQRSVLSSHHAWRFIVLRLEPHSD